MEARNTVVLPRIVFLGKVFVQLRKRLHCSRNKEHVVQISIVVPCYTFLTTTSQKQKSCLGGVCPLNTPGRKGGSPSDTGCEKEQKIVQQYPFLRLSLCLPGKVFVLARGKKIIADN